MLLKANKYYMPNINKYYFPNVNIIFIMYNILMNVQIAMFYSGNENCNLVAYSLLCYAFLLIISKC